MPRMDVYEGEAPRVFGFEFRGETAPAQCRSNVTFTSDSATYACLDADGFLVVSGAVRADASHATTKVPTDGRVGLFALSDDGLAVAVSEPSVGASRVYFRRDRASPFERDDLSMCLAVDLSVSANQAKLVAAACEDGSVEAYLYDFLSDPPYKRVFYRQWDSICGVAVDPTA